MSAHENSNQRSMTSDERKALDEFTMHELKPHENDGKTLGQIAYDAVFRDSEPYDEICPTRQRDFTEVANAVAAEVRRRDGNRVAELEADIKEVTAEAIYLGKIATERRIEIDRLKAEVERLKGENAKLLEQRETISDAQDQASKELWKAKEKFSADWEAREKEVDAMRNSVKRMGEIIVLLQRENEDLKRAEKERPERQLEEFTKAAMQGLCAPVFAAMPNGDWPSISLDVEDEIAITAKSIAQKTLAALQDEGGAK